MKFKIGDLVALKAYPHRIFIVLEDSNIYEVKVNEIGIDLVTYSNPSSFKKVS